MSETSKTAPASRLEQLIDWVTTPLKQQQMALGLTPQCPVQPVPLTGDAGFRRYFRVTNADASWILVDAPPETENTLGFTEIAAALAVQHVHVPHIIAVDLQRGFMLLTDLGEELYSTALTGADSSTVSLLYGDAIAALHRIQKTQATPAYPLPTFDRATLTSVH